LSKHYINEVGTLFLLDCGIDVSDSTLARILYKKPGGVVGTWPGTLYSSYSKEVGMAGTYFVSYTLAGSDANVAGEWEFQALVANTAGTWFGENVQMTLYATFE